MKSSLPKQFLELAGVPILARTVNKFLAFDPDMQVVLVLPKTTHHFWNELCLSHLSKEDHGRIHLAMGGSTRTGSVLSGLEKAASLIPEPADSWVAIHDGVRPFVNEEMIRKAFEIAVEKGASVACVPVKSSLRRVFPDQMSEAIDRSEYVHVQTPQTFRLDAILKAYHTRPEGTFTDDASLFEATVGRVALSPGSYDNLKVTTPEDLFVGEKILARESHS